MQPVYTKSENKIQARQENTTIYRALTGKHSIPKDRGYWTLCNQQPPEDGSEIEQLTKEGLIQKAQFYGVDWDKGIIDQNRIWHPEAKWFNGDWLDVIEDQENFNPGLIYLDTTAFADHHHSTQMTVRTMLRCPVGTVLLVNVMMNDPRSPKKKKFKADILMKEIAKKVPISDLKKWDKEIKNYVYQTTRYTQMGTFIFYKRGITN
jgi:hypothetical protein